MLLFRVVVDGFVSGNSSKVQRLSRKGVQATGVAWKRLTPHKRVMI